MRITVTESGDVEYEGYLTLGCPWCQMNTAGQHQEHCPNHPDNQPKQVTGGIHGWICPVCGRGNSPWSSVCPCNPVAIEITYTPGVTYSPDWSRGYTYGGLVAA